jgi:hypothetical protein
MKEFQMKVAGETKYSSFRKSTVYEIITKRTGQPETSKTIENNMAERRWRFALRVIIQGLIIFDTYAFYRMKI